MGEDIRPAPGQVWRSKYESETVESIYGNKVRWVGGEWDYLNDLGPASSGASYLLVRCQHGRADKCISCEADAAPKCKHGNPWFCGLCGSHKDGFPTSAEFDANGRRIGGGSVTYSNVTFGGAVSPAAIVDEFRKWAEKLAAPRPMREHERVADAMTALGRPMTPDDVKRIAERLGAKVAPKPDPRAEREQRRREIDAVLAEDARRFPAFATARRAAVAASVEHQERASGPGPFTASMASRILRDLHMYEKERGIGSKPSARVEALELLSEEEQAAYERARGMR